ncbi:DUF6602 domain-containing protein [Paenibacillus sp. FSL L8-0493]|uniref:DUF6602 domain-containing protein n=1 Tax=unclassified Paenibacillus TaxID=185978 RepID=UPI0030FC060A
MLEDITKVFEEYAEQIMFCKFFIAERLKHNAEMGRCGENILLNELKERFGMLSFVSGFIVCNGIQSPQCDILVCRRNMYRRKLEGELYLVSPMDCLMTIEVKGNLTLTDIAETNRKNNFFKEHDETSHIRLALFAFKTRIGKKTLYSEFGYNYEREIKSFYPGQLSVEKWIDLFICLHRDSFNESASRDKQLLFFKDMQNSNQYFLDNNYPVTQNFFLYLQSLQEF